MILWYSGLPASTHGVCSWSSKLDGQDTLIQNNSGFLEEHAHLGLHSSCITSPVCEPRRKTAARPSCLSSLHSVSSTSSPPAPAALPSEWCSRACATLQLASTCWAGTRTGGAGGQGLLAQKCYFSTTALQLASTCRVFLRLFC